MRIERYRPAAPRSPGSARRLLPVLFLFGALGSAACGDSSAVRPVSFWTPTPNTYGAGPSISALGLGDVDGDNRLDVVLNQESHLFILRGDGAGRLDTVPLDGGTTFSVNVTLGDVTGDGRVDLVGSGGDSGNVRIYPGLSDGTFGPSIAYGIPAQQLSQVSLADMTGDGKLDVVVQASGTGVIPFGGAAIAILPNRGDGSFGDALMFSLATAPPGTAIADFDGNGTVDVIFPDPELQGAQLLLNDGKGHLQMGPFSQAPFAGGPIHTGDVDGDGRPDLIMLDGQTDGLAILRNVGNGMLEHATTTHLGVTSLDVATADFNGDGLTDVAVIESTGALAILRATPTLEMHVAGIYSAGGFPTFVRAGDIDNDGDIDVVSGNQVSIGGNVGVLLNDGTGSFNGTPLQPVQGGTVAMAVADVTGDGQKDVVLAMAGVMGEQSLAVLEGPRGMNALTLQRLVVIGGAPAFALDVGDVNGDNIPDIVISTSESPGAKTLLGTGGGSFGVPISLSVDPLGPIALADLDGDSHTDLVAAFQVLAGDVGFFGGDGLGMFTLRKTFHIGDQSPLALLVADANGDRRLDVITTQLSFDGSTAIDVVGGSGQGQFAAPLSFPVFPSLGTLVTADFNRDGRPDFAGSSVDSVEVPLLLGTPGGQQLNRESLDLGTTTNGAAAADLNDDKWPDLVFTDAQSQNVLLLLNDRHGHFPDRQMVRVGLDAGPLATGDVNGDGKTDIIVLSSAGVVVLWNTSK